MRKLIRAPIRRSFCCAEENPMEVALPVPDAGLMEYNVPHCESFPARHRVPAININSHRVYPISSEKINRCSTFAVLLIIIADGRSCFSMYRNVCIRPGKFYSMSLFRTGNKNIDNYHFGAILYRHQRAPFNLFRQHADRERNRKSFPLLWRSLLQE